jgi:hypothetical protein
MKIPLATLVLCIATPALAHSWYPPECCNRDRDCHPVPCEEITLGKMGMYGGYWWRRGQPEGQFFTARQHRWSQDDGCHVCISIGETKTEIPRCIFTTPPVQS